jgi:hypothetical protein
MLFVETIFVTFENNEKKNKCTLWAKYRDFCVTAVGAYGTSKG